MTTPQIIKRIARKLGITMRVPSSESQKLEAIDGALPKFTSAPPFVESAVLVDGSTDLAITLTFNEPVELNTTVAPSVFTAYAVETAAGLIEGAATAVVQTSPTEITVTTETLLSVTADYLAVRMTTSDAIVSVATLAPAKAGADGILALIGV